MLLQPQAEKLFQNLVNTKKTFGEGFFCGLVTVLCLKRNEAPGVHIPRRHGPAHHTEQPQLPLQHHQLCQSLLPHGLETVRKEHPLPPMARNAALAVPRAPLPSAAGSQPPSLPAQSQASEQLGGALSQRGEKKRCPQPAPWSQVLAPHHSALLGLLQCHVQQQPLVKLSAERLFRNNPSFLGGTERGVGGCCFFK